MTPDRTTQGDDGGGIGALPAARAATASRPSPAVLGQAGIANAACAECGEPGATWWSADRTRGMCDECVSAAWLLWAKNSEDPYALMTAKAMEARRAETGTGSVEDDSAARQGLPETSLGGSNDR